MQELRTPAQEAAEDIFFGQLAIIVARWYLIVAATILMVWTIVDPGQLALSILPVVGLMVMNFFLHGRYLMEQPANQRLIIATSLLDLLLITLMALFWPGERGLASPLFIFYYPVVLAFGFVVARRIEVMYTGLALISYTAACFATNPALLASVGDVKHLVLRLVTIGAAGGLANYFWRIQRERRRTAVGGTTIRQDLVAQPGAGTR